MTSLPPNISFLDLSFHPSFALRGMPQLKPLIRNVIARACEGRARPPLQVVIGATAEQMRTELEGQCVAAFDVENPRHTKRIVDIVSISATPGRALVARWTPGVADALRPWMEDERNIAGGHNLAHDQEAVYWQGIRLRARVFDTMQACAIVHPPLGQAKEMKWLRLEACVQRYLAGVPSWKPEVRGENQPPDWRRAHALYRAWFPEVHESAYDELYCGIDGGMTRWLMEEIIEYLKATGQWELFTRVVMPCAPALTRMTIRGIPLDTRRRDEMRAQAEEQRAGAIADARARTSAMHARRRERLERAMSELEREKQGAFDQYLQRCARHPTYRPTTIRIPKCDDCRSTHSDSAGTRVLARDLQKRITRGRARLRQIGVELNASNPNAWRHLLYSEPDAGGLGLVPPGWARTEGGEKSVKIGVIEQLLAKYGGREAFAEACALIKDRLIIAHAEHRWNPESRKGTLAVEPEDDGRVHYPFSMHRSDGRLASGTDEDEDDKRRVSKAGQGHNIPDADRSIYCASGAGRVCLSWDYSQIEAWIVAWHARDMRMLELYKKMWEYHSRGEKVPDEYDVHCRAAAMIYKVDPRETRKRQVRFEGKSVSMRYAAKRMRHGKNYGMDFPKGARMYGLAEDEARRLWAADDEAWPATAAWRERIPQMAARDRGLRNSFGRWLPYLTWARNRKTGAWEFAEREEALAGIPRTDASEIFKSVIPEFERVSEEFGAWPCNCPHDGLWQDAEVATLGKMVPRVKAIMEREWPQLGRIEGIGSFRCPVEVEAGGNYAKRHEVHGEECEVGCVLNPQGLVSLEEWKRDANAA